MAGTRRLWRRGWRLRSTAPAKRRSASRWRFMAKAARFPSWPCWARNSPAPSLSSPVCWVRIPTPTAPTNFCTLPLPRNYRPVSPRCWRTTPLGNRSAEHQRADIPRRRRTVAQHPVVIGFQAEAGLFLRSCAQPIMLLPSHEIGGELGGAHPRPVPFSGRLAFLLECGLCHQAHRILAAHAVAMDRLVQDGVGNGAQIDLELRQPIERV